MKYSILVCTALVVAAISCAPAPTRAPQIQSAPATSQPAAVPTSEPLTLAPTNAQPAEELLVPTATPIAIPTPTHSPTAPPTFTHTPTIRPSPTEAPSPTATPSVAPTVEILRPLGSPIFQSADGLSGFSGEGHDRSDEKSKYVNADGFYQAIIDGPPPVQNTDRMHRPYPDIFFNQPFTQSFATEFRVKVGSDLAPASTLGPYQANPWLNLFSAFDEGLRGSSGKRHASLLVNLVGRKGTYHLQTFASAEVGTYFPIHGNAPVFPLDTWVEVRVEVDFAARAITTYQDGRLVSQGPYTAANLHATGFHWGAYANSKITKATVSNANILVAPLK